MVDWKPSTADHATLERIKGLDWHQDWSGVYSRLEGSLDRDSYFGVFEEAAGIRFSHCLLTFEGETAIGWLPTQESERVGTTLAQKMLDPGFLESWVSAYRSYADTLTQFVQLPHAEFLNRFSEYKDLYPRLAPYVIGTKIAFNLLPMGHDDVAAKLEEARRYTEMFYKNSSRVMNELQQSIAEKTAYRVASIRALSVEELCEYAAAGVLPDEAFLEQRSLIAGLYMEPGVQSFLTAENVAQLRKSWEVAAVSDDAIRGTTAYRGVVQGRVRIVIDYRDATLEEGEILVMTMTDPRFVPIMKKAGAIVTDGGGMLCHAAIVARELKKPCVIGAKLATQFLRDGDLVEVDADSGRVSVIARA